MASTALLGLAPGPLREALVKALAEAGLAGDLREREIRDIIEGGGFDLVVASPAALPTPWSATISQLRALPERPEVILVGVGDDAVRAELQAAGAFAVLGPLRDSEQWSRASSGVLLRFRELSAGRRRGDNETIDPLAAIASESGAMKRIRDLAQRVASADTTLLILGETGVGKEWLARSIHSQGPRAEAPFVPVNCAAIPEGLMESELFGHEAGAFTGAQRVRRGAFEMAHRGTLFLDEIGELAPHLQVKLLRVLQERRVQRLGAETQTPTDARVIAATNRDLRADMEAGHFRPDLYYRLSVVVLQIPPLREREQDIATLALELLELFRSKLGRPLLRGLTPAATEALQRHAWPGNVRELANTIERAVLLSEGEWIDEPDLLEPQAVRPRPTPTGAAGPSEGEIKPLPAARREVVRDFERSYLRSLLTATRGQVGAAARLAGIDSRTLYNKMKRYGLDKAEFRR